MKTEVTIIIADDDLDFCQILQKKFEKRFKQAGIIPRISICADGRECIAIYKDKRPDIIIMDVMMPVMNGWEACRSIRQIENDLHEGTGRRTFIIIVTALGPQLNEMTSPLYDADEYFDKPINMESLVNLVYSHIKSTATT